MAMPQKDSIDTARKVCWPFRALAGALLHLAAFGCNETSTLVRDAGEALDPSDDGGVADAAFPEPELANRKECPTSNPLPALSYECDEAVCYSVIRLDFHTQELRGWATSGGVSNPINADNARTIALQAFEALTPRTTLSPQLDGPHAGVFLAYTHPGDHGAFALIGSDTGIVVVGGAVSWSRDERRYFEEVKWRPANDLACNESAAEPVDSFVGKTFCGVQLVAAPPRGAAHALKTVLRTNLAAEVAARGAFSAFVTLYGVTGQECDKADAEWLVTLTQKRE